MKKKHNARQALAAALSMLLLCVPCARAEEVNDDDMPTGAYYRDVEVCSGVVVAEMKVNLRRTPSTDGDILDRVAPGVPFTVLDTSNPEWTKVKYNGTIGYLSAQYVKTETYTDQVEVIIEDPLEASSSNFDFPGIMKKGQSVTLRGNLATNIPMVSVKAEVLNLRTLKIELTAEKTFDHEEGIKTFDLNELDKAMAFRRLSSGEKRMIVTISSAEDSIEVIEQDFYVTGSCEDLIHMTDACTITATSGRKSYLTDNSYRTACSLDTAEDTLTVAIPDDRTAALLTMSWNKAPYSFSVVEMNSEGGIVESIDEENESGMLTYAYDLTAEVKKIVISTPDSACGGICELRVMEEGSVSEEVQRWQPVEGKVDLMVISAHQDDELLFFGGTIPYYSAMGKNVAVVYMADCSRSRYAEAMNGLWSCGLKNHPIFLGFTDKRIDNYDQTVELWGLEKTEETLVELIRKYQPDVIVTHDINGEYGHNQHKLTSAAVRRAVPMASDPESYPASAEKYGVWDTKKLYVHLYEGNEIVMNVYDEPLDELNGLTPTEAATIGYSKHVSQQKYYSMEKQGVQYDNRKYGLIRTTVDYDVLKNDFFENIPVEEADYTENGGYIEDDGYTDEGAYAEDDGFIDDGGESLENAE